jgi:preprotein translocase subunit YajC
LPGETRTQKAYGMLSLTPPSTWTSLWLAQSAQGAGDMRPLLFMLLAIGAIFYFIVLRPQRNEQKKREEMLNAVAKGDHVVTIGGIHGTVEAIDVTKNIVSVSVAPKVTIRVNRAALASISSRKRGDGDDKDKSKDKD